LNTDFIRSVDYRGTEEAERGSEGTEDEQFCIDLIGSEEAELDGNELIVCKEQAKNNSYPTNS